MIDEKELLKTLNDAGINITFDIPVEEILDNDVNLDGFVALIQDAVIACKKMVIDTIESMPKVGVWIPVSERLPEKKGEYLFTTNSYSGATIEIYTFDPENNWDVEFAKTSMDLMAWMPLPEPYGEEKANETD